MIPNLPLSSLKIVSGTREQPGLSDALNLKPGRVINAKVVDVQPENRAQLILAEKPDAGSTLGELSGSRSGGATGPVFEGAAGVSGTQSAGTGKTVVSTPQIALNESAQPVASDQKVTVSTSLPLKSGMSLTLTAAATREGMVLKPAPSTVFSSSASLSMPKGSTDAELKILPGTQDLSGLSGTRIKPGQTVQVKVSDVTPQNRALLLVGGQKLSVTTELPLTRGMEIPMKVVQSGQGIVLKPIVAAQAPSSTAVAGSAADSAREPGVNTQAPVSSVPSSLSKSGSLTRTQQTASSPFSQSFSPAKILQGLGALSQAREPVLTDILMGLALKSDVRDDQFLPKIMENMGLSLENKLMKGLSGAGDKKDISQMIQQLADQDLKAATLSLSANQSDLEKSQVLKHITNALDHLAQINVKSGDGAQTQDGARFLLPFPVWTEEGFDFGQIMVDTGKAGTAVKDKILSISFLLDMTALGPLRADFSILDKTIAGRFLLENQEICDYLAPKISGLKQNLAGIGYQAGNIECQVARPEQITPACLVLSMKEPDDMQGLNIVV